MGFPSDANAVRDESRSTASRVWHLCRCLEQFNLFGWHATFDRLRFMAGSSAPPWSSQQLLAAIEPLAHAQRSWTRVTLAEQRRRRRHKARGDRTLNGTFTNRELQLRMKWQLQYLSDGENARRWFVEDLGDCDECLHPWILHGHSCGVCTIVSNAILDQVISIGLVPLPNPHDDWTVPAYVPNSCRLDLLLPARLRIVS